MRSITEALERTVISDSARDGRGADVGSSRGVQFLSSGFTCIGCVRHTKPIGSSSSEKLRPTINVAPNVTATIANRSLGSTTRIASLLACLPHFVNTNRRPVGIVPGNCAQKMLPLLDKYQGRNPKVLGSHIPDSMLKSIPARTCFRGRSKGNPQRLAQHSGQP